MLGDFTLNYRSEKSSDLFRKREKYLSNTSMDAKYLLDEPHLDRG
ncbi:hypothetical protein [Azospirillum doebereinerae]